MTTPGASPRACAWARRGGLALVAYAAMSLGLVGSAHAVSYDYCGIARLSSEACWAPNNSNPAIAYYRYNEGHTAYSQVVQSMCSFLRTPPPGNNDRAGSGCWGNTYQHIINRCSDAPDTRAFIYHWGSPGYYWLYGHADNAYRSGCS